MNSAKFLRAPDVLQNTSRRLLSIYVRVKPLPEVISEGVLSKKVLLKNFARFTGKHYRFLSLGKMQA